ncbi:MAG: helix-turn-helix domain-containing protein [Acidobacteria bacterium]|nr:helix-turn-helix domain-containing protein [Acidobacteriota bacterium]
MVLRDQQPLPFDNRQEALRGTERLLSAQELAVYLEVPVKTIYAWRCHKTGPRGFRVGKHLRFRWCDIESWLADLIAEER